MGGACGKGIDLWSLGCVLAEVALQRPLFPITTTAELTHQVIPCYSLINIDDMLRMEP